MTGDLTGDLTGTEKVEKSLKSLEPSLLCPGGDRGACCSVVGGVDGETKGMGDRGGGVVGSDVVADAGSGGDRGASASVFGGVDGDIKGMGDMCMEDRGGGILGIGVVDRGCVMGSGGVVGDVVDRRVGRRVGDVVDTTDASRGGVSGGVSGDVIFD